MNNIKEDADRPGKKVQSANDDKKNTGIELYKMEYEKAAERYHNIYQSAWSNFSYLTALAAGIIAFGKGFPPYLIITAAAGPLIFWYLAVFEPANVYGDQVMHRLSEIEKTVNGTYDVTLSHFTTFAERREQAAKWLSVRRVVRLVALLLAIGLILLLSFGRELKMADKSESVSLEQTNKPLAVKVVGGEEFQRLSQENQQLLRAVDELRRSLESISNDLKAERERSKN